MLPICLHCCLLQKLPMMPHRLFCHCAARVSMQSSPLHPHSSECPWQHIATSDAECTASVSFKRQAKMRWGFASTSTGAAGWAVFCSCCNRERHIFLPHTATADMLRVDHQFLAVHAMTILKTRPLPGISATWWQQPCSRP